MPITGSGDQRSSGRVGVRAVVFVLGGTSVASLLAWVFDLGSFGAWFRLVSVPGQIVLILLAVWVARRADLADLRTTLIAGTVGGIVGTIGYDLFRIPFVVAGLRVLAPIDSYGVLALDAATSSPLTGFVGWSYHAANGIGFGIAYAVLAGRGRRWPWAVGWALVLETATVATPFAERYGLSGRWVPIAIAYAAHVPFGVALGLAVERADAIDAELRAVGRWAVPALLVVIVAVLALWQRPWTDDVPRELADAERPAVLVRDQRFEPEWLRVGVGGCASFVNVDAATYELDVGNPAVLAGQSTTRVCFDTPGVHRVHTLDEPYAGGFVIVDEHA